MIVRSVLFLLVGASAGMGAAVDTHGWGYGVKGGEGGALLMVTRLDDDVKRPVPGMLRWALAQQGARVIRFEVHGDLWLKDRVLVRHGALTVDGSDAPEEGVCVRGGALEFVGCREVIVRNLRVRLGDEQVLRKMKKERRKRPVGSAGLDCVSLYECRGVVLDHLSLGWSCDELLAVVRCQQVTVQWCLLAEPLGNPNIHPYGDTHAYGILCSASTLTIHHCVMAHFWMRGPQFEANDTRKTDKWVVRMEAVGNVFADFGRSGSRYTTGVEDHRKDSKGRQFQFQLIGNVYLDSGQTGRSIEAVTKHGVHDGVRVWLENNWFRGASSTFLQDASVIKLDDDSLISQAPQSIRRQISRERLFTSPHSPSVDLGGAGLSRLLEVVGAGPVRDRHDQRVISEILAGRVRPILRSQEDL
jgi:hypothetical protein